MGIVLSFKPRSAQGRGQDALAPDGTQRDISAIDDLAKYEQTNEADDYRHRMLVNAIAAVLVAVLVAAGVWIASTMADLQKKQDCVLQGRRNCAPINVETLNRR